MQFSEAEIRETIETNMGFIRNGRPCSFENYATTLARSIWALEKQIPKLAEIATYGGHQFLRCPDCGNDSRLTAKCCDGCGQAIAGGRESC